MFVVLFLSVGLPTQAQSSSYQEAVNAISSRIASFFVDNQGKPQKIGFLPLQDGTVQAVCEPLSTVLSDGLRRELIRYREMFKLRFHVVRESDPNLVDTMVAGNWLNSGNGEVTLHMRMGREQAGIFQDVRQEKANFEAVTLPVEAQRCLLEFDPVDEQLAVSRPLLVRSAPAPMAKVIEEVSPGNFLWVTARVRGTKWRVVRLSDDEEMPVGFRQRRGFVHGRIKQSAPLGIVKHKLTVKVLPKNALVTLLNVEQSYRPGMVLFPGKYHLEISSKGYNTVRKWVDLSQSDLMFTIALTKIEKTTALESAKLDTPFSFRVNYVYRSGNTGMFKPIQPGSRLHSNDQYKIIFSSDQQAYVYIFQVDSAGQIVQLFPMERYGNLVLNNLNPVNFGKTVFLPARDKAFTLDDQIGTERIYFVASRQRSMELESLYQELMEARRKRQDVRAERAQTLLRRNFKARGMRGIVPTIVEPVTWQENGKLFSVIGRKLEDLCENCVETIEFLHK